VTVHLVGAGPGDPGLLTVRALELLRSCDAVVADTLVCPDVLREVPDDALVVSRAGMSQEQVNELLVRLGRRGLDVVRLKGGDPFVFGRGGEEALALAAAGIPFTVVPGVSALAAVPAAALIPVTHRGVAHTVTLSTGRAENGDEPDYDALVAGGGTIVLFMGLGRLAVIAAGLMQAGLPQSTAAAVVAGGTLPEQEVVVADLAGIAEAAEGLSSPALLVVGDVVRVGVALKQATETAFQHQG
jgi:uroporphyrin-III C-methyltransferase